MLVLFIGLGVFLSIVLVHGAYRAGIDVGKETMLEEIGNKPSYGCYTFYSVNKALEAMQGFAEAMKTFSTLHINDFHTARKEHHE